jgi:hypothetical protein
VCDFPQLLLLNADVFLILLSFEIVFRIHTVITVLKWFRYFIRRR